MSDSEDLLFSEDEYGQDDDVRESDEIPWNVLIVDDEPEVHSVTKLVLADFEWEGRPLRFFNAYTAIEAREILVEEPSISVCLVDVVMETNEAGLDLVRYIRGDLDNNQVRLILRTGQPGYAPEKSVIRDYDINDYKDKTELTDVKLHTLMCSALRGYRDIIRLDANRVGLEMVIESSARIFETTSLKKFTNAVLIQIMSLLGINRDAFFLKVLSGFSALADHGSFQVLAGVGKFEKEVGEDSFQRLDISVRELLERTLNSRCSIFEVGHLVMYSESKLGTQHLLYLQHHGELTVLDKQLVELFCSNASIAFENHILRDDLEQTQKEMVYRLGEAVENRSRETGNHIRRVAKMSYVLAKDLGHSEEFALRVKIAAPLHDIGKIGVPDHVLNKPGKLDADEWNVMMTHVNMGHDMLKGSGREIMDFAAHIARDHHEKWDGSGYPRGVKGEDIHVLGRIVAVADVFDALVNKRCYKEAWSMDDAVALLKKESGFHFDPDIIQSFVRRLNDMLDIQQQYSD